MQMSDATLTAFSAISELRSAPFPQSQADRLDVTTHDSPGYDRQFKSGLNDLSAVTFDINWLPASAAHDHTTGLLSVQRSKATRVFKVTLPTTISPPQVWTFSGEITQFNPTAPVDGILQASVQLQPSGQPAIASS